MDIYVSKTSLTEKSLFKKTQLLSIWHPFDGVEVKMVEIKTLKKFQPFFVYRRKIYLQQQQKL